MSKNLHEIRDPIHVFVHLDTDERKVLDSAPFQRLRNIHQLALSYLVYPGATHTRFEHSLGVMHIATEIFDVLTSEDAIQDGIRKILPDISQPDIRNYWRRVLRMAALCHDIGHLPFSHAAEDELLPEGWDHERLTVELIRSSEMETIWNAVTPPLRSANIAKLAVGPKKWKESRFTDWEAILSEIIVGDAFGADRIDYLLRDSYHAGVAYGKFDHFRLIDTLRILQNPGSEEPSIGIESGGIHSAEALLLARYFMFQQVYMHPVRRIYDWHLKEFLRLWLPEGKFPKDINGHLKYDDISVLHGMQESINKTSEPVCEIAKRICERKHFKVVYSLNISDTKIHPQPGKVLAKELSKKYGEANVHHDIYYKNSGGLIDFPLLNQNGEVISARAESKTLAFLPPTAIDCIFIHPKYRDEASKWLAKEKNTLLEKTPVEGEEK
jgi:uncharacterized protein